MSNLKIIAEIGINHNGDIKIAKDLIDMAHRCDADIVKFQKRDIDQVYEQDFLFEYFDNYKPDFVINFAALAYATSWDKSFRY